jgi:hypothetical protein
MKAERSSSQILFGFLPEQTVDLQGSIWKVDRWHTLPTTSRVDVTSLRSELRRLAGPWRATNRDGGFVTDLDRGRELTVLQLDKTRGVEVGVYPRIWKCKTCSRISTDSSRECRCHSLKFGQLPFVGYCKECGDLRPPFIPRCKTHNDVAIRLPGTSSAREIVFYCPVCNAELRRGFGSPNCQCGNGRLTYNVHRAASVFTPRTFVLVNPPSPEKIKVIGQAGGPARALAWVVDGMVERGVEATRPTRDSLRSQLEAQGFDRATIELMLRAAEGSANLRAATDDLSLSQPAAEAAQAQAVTIALAACESRQLIGDLCASTDAASQRGVLYRDSYPAAMRAAGVDAVELLDKFPVLTGTYGYTRGPGDAGQSRLRAYRDARGTYQLYADLVETEALLVRLSPIRVVRWLRRRGHQIEECHDDRTARLAVLRSAEIPDLSGADVNSIGADVLRLVHSFSHRFIRTTAVHAGIDRNGLSELLVPLHLGFYVYAAGRGDFVLGGLQAVFEGELGRLLNDFVHGEHRCALDPGCGRAGGACVACLHVGEPACRFFNRYLNRDALFGPSGYFQQL